MKTITNDVAIAAETGNDVSDPKPDRCNVLSECHDPHPSEPDLVVRPFMKFVLWAVGIFLIIEGTGCIVASVLVGFELNNNPALNEFIAVGWLVLGMGIYSVWAGFLVMCRPSRFSVRHSSRILALYGWVILIDASLSIPSDNLQLFLGYFWLTLLLFFLLSRRLSDLICRLSFTASGR